MKHCLSLTALSTLLCTTVAHAQTPVVTDDRKPGASKVSSTTPTTAPATTHVSVPRATLTTATGNNAESVREDSAYDALTPGKSRYSSTQADPASPDIYGPGEITVYGTRRQRGMVGSNSLSAESIYVFNKTTLDQAANLIPGVNAASTGGPRNESTIMVRGFNRFQVPLLVDGIRIYLPADNRLDYGRFLTPDIAELQVAKGYASVLDGPDAMGGMVNLVTRKPHKAIEGELRGGSMLGHDGGYGGYNVFGRVGTKQDKWYAQVSFAVNNVDHTDLSSNYTPTATQGKGKRLLSDSEDWRVNVKAGYTPNATDEYTVNYTRQEGQKRAPFDVHDPVSTQKDWTWPAWNLDSLSLTSRTRLADRLTLRSRLYRNTFYNLLSSYDNASLNTQTKPKAFNSFYNDSAWGGNIRLDAEISSKDTLGIAFYGRRDEHQEQEQVYPGGGWQPQVSSVEESYSIAGENVFRILPNLDLTTGVSYEWRVLDRAQGYSSGVINYATRNRGAPNGQARLSWRPDTASELHISVSDRVRFPTLFERFSTRFGGATSNPGLRPERAQNYELGGSHTFGNIDVAGALFYSHLTDLIADFPTIYNGVAVSQSRNISSGNYAGAEISISIPIRKDLLVGGNYTYIHQSVNDPVTRIYKATDVPNHKAFVYVQWEPIKGLRFVPSVSINSNRWTTNTAGTAYFRTGRNVDVAARVDYQITPNVQVGVNASNLLDQNYQLVDGFPSQGRNFFVNLRISG
ncbi:TonB-dependent receptor plug domain-containing protein [Acetobacter sp.]|uniref:TonB-dependent receptor plug domain-containing protein n=1 Tax=Acetobacter sp. TaxID=440 RepID=UPI0039E846A6